MALALFGTDAWASRRDLCNLLTKRSEILLGRMDEMDPKPGCGNSLNGSEYFDVWKDAMVGELEGLKVVKVLTLCDKPPVVKT